ncbi:hypothetical protein [Alicyclobacillus herbarius]|uniref:hypothetical protein n=1 Tax=Alicyclobacillus herbarius TaxID=122960 RepID=UPI0004229B0D|nr:hypothetical protein [Alicyclobacillus herbarius]
MGSYFPKALVYKEWRETHGWLIGAGLFILSEPLLRLLVLGLGLVEGQNESGLRAMAWNAFASYLTDVVTRMHSDGTTGFLAILAVMVVAEVQVAQERSQGRLLCVLMGPVTRADLLRVKFVLGAAWLFALIVVFTLIVTVSGAFAPERPSPATLAAFALDELAILAAFYGMAFLVACVVTGAFPVLIITAILVDAPIWLPNLVAFNSSPNQPQQWPGVVAHISPWSWLNAPVPIPWLAVLWLFFLAAFGYWAGQRAFARVHAEHFQDLFGLPVIWRLVPWVVSLALGLIPAAMTSRHFNETRWFPLVWLVLACVLYAGLRGVMWVIFRNPDND